MNPTSLQKASPASPTANGKSSLKLVVRGLGHIPSKKNFHYPRKNGSLGIDQRIKDWMEKCEKLLAYQLLCAFQTTAGGTLTARSLRSWIASSVPQDDAWQVIPLITISVEKVVKGEEGAEILIEEIL